jgi:hypothetical protein
MDKAPILIRMWISVILLLLGIFVGYILGYPWLGLVIPLVLLLGEGIWQYCSVLRWARQCERGQDSDEQDPGALWAPVVFARKRLERNHWTSFFGCRNVVGSPRAFRLVEQFR